MQIKIERTKRIDQLMNFPSYFHCLFRNTAVVETIVPYILMKTQHHYSNIREYSMKTLAALILEDYLKFRGTLLVYVLAALLDQQREIKELAVELIMKYTTEKSDIFLRTCLVECPFAFNACPCFGQGLSGSIRSSSILKSAEKRGAREYIYSYLIRKIEATHLYMYFGNFTRLHECIQKEPDLLESSDFQSAIIDFLFICSEICVVNEKEKKNLEKIVKENHDGEGIAVNDDDENEAIDKATAATATGIGAADGEKKGRGGKKNQPTLKQSLAAVEKIVPLISSIDSKLKFVNSDLFQPVMDKFCINMCVHFESLLEYAQPRDFWAPYLKKAKHSASVATKPTKKAPPKVVEAMQPPCTIPPSLSTANQTPKSSKRKENDSGHFTLDGGDVDDQSSKRSTRAGSTRRCASRASNRTASQSSDISAVNTPKRGRKRSASIDFDSQNDSDNESIFSELSDITEASQLRKNTQTDSSKKKAKKTTAPPTPKTPASRKSSRR